MSDKFHITFAQSESSVDESEYKVYEIKSLKDFDAKFARCLKGRKLGEGFIRGQLIDAPRLDEHLEYSRILVIDADGGIDDKPTPHIDDTHRALAKLGYNHILYTTHSHTDDYHKYRGIVLMSEDIQQHELHTNMNHLISELKAQGVSLAYAHEMDTWSQIWFMPRSDNPELYQHRSWFEGESFTTIHIAEEDVPPKERQRKTSEQRKASGEQETLDDMFTNIREGTEFHHSLRNISYQLAKEHVPRAIILAQLRSVMESSKEAGSKRWLDRMKDLERLVDGGIARAKDEEAAEFELPKTEGEAPRYVPPPMPPGRLGKAIQQCLDTMPRPALEYAFPMILGSISAICGARWNAYTNELSGLNLAFTIVAETGYGKGQVSKFYKHLFAGGLGGKIINISGGNGSASFLGENNYSAPKSLYEDLKMGRSKISCMQEAGIMLGAKSGNVNELTAYLMENFLNSDANSYSSTRRYTDDEKSIKAIKAPAISFLLESTEKSLADSLKDMNALDSGFIPRQTMFKVTERPKLNRNRGGKASYDFDDDVVSQFKRLMNEGSKIQAVESFEPLIVNFTNTQCEDYFDMYENYSDNYQADPIEKIIASRMAHKVIKLASLCTLFNSWKDDGDINLDQDAWEWAKAMGKWEMDNINHNLSYMTNSNQYDYAIEHIKERLIAALKHNGTSARQRMAKVVRLKMLDDRLNSKFKELANSNRMNRHDYLNKTLTSMERMGYIKRLNGHPTIKVKKAPCIQILEGMFK